MRPTRRDTLPGGGKRGGALFGAVAVGLLAALACPPAGRAQANPEPSINDYLPSGEPEPSREDWRQRVEDAKRRAKEAGRQRRENPEIYMPIPEDQEMVASERVLNDESLQRGDIVATKKGMFVYQGRSDQPRRDQDFLPIDPKPSR